jgi:hypothetical protein
MELQAKTESRIIDAARETDRAEVLSVYQNLHLTNAAQLASIGTARPDAQALAHADAGRVPYIVRLDCVREGVWPFSAVSECIDALEPYTLIAWR